LVLSLFMNENYWTRMLIVKRFISKIRIRILLSTHHA
jgi:hypothetical protein